MEIPFRGRLDAKDRVPVVHDQRIIRLDVAAHCVCFEVLTVANGFRVLGGNDCAWHTAVHVNHHGLFARASGEQQQWNQMQEFHGSKWECCGCG